jgi:hypothetical protein
MTTTLTESVYTAITSQSYAVFSTGIGLIVVVTAFILVLLKELLRAADTEHTRHHIQVLNIAVWPLLGAAGIIFLQRLLDLIQPH